MPYKRLIFGCILLVFSAGALFFAVPRHASNEGMHSQPPHARAPRDFDSFRINDLSMVEKKGNSVLFSLSAKQVVHRKRRNDFFVYNNIKEIYMRDVRLDIYPGTAEVTAAVTAGADHTVKQIAPARPRRATERPRFVKKDISIPAKDIGGIFHNLSDSTPIKRYLSGHPDIDLNLLSRLLMENMVMVFHLGDGKTLSISAGGAILNLDDLQNMIFIDNVVITGSDGYRIETDKCIWSRKFHGILFPHGYTASRREVHGGHFFLVSRGGVLSRTAHVPKVNYVDLLGQREKELIDRLGKYLPGYLQLILKSREEFLGASSKPAL